MHKYYYVAIFLFLLALSIDLISVKIATPENTIARFESNLDRLLEEEGLIYLDTQYLSLLDQNSYSLQDLNRIKTVEDRIIKKGLHVQLYKDKNLVFWAGDKSMDQLCRTFGESQYHIRICTDIFNSESTIAEHIRENINPAPEFTLDLESEHMVFDQSVAISSLYRATATQILTLSLYFLALILALFTTVTTENRYALSVIFIFRIITMLIPWPSAFKAIDAANPIFADLSYTTLGLLIDAIIIFSLINLAGRKQLLLTVRRKSGYIIQSGIILLVLGILSHIRLIQLLVGSDKVLNNFSDISKFSSTDILALTALLILLQSIFIYSNTLFVNISRLNISKKQTYLQSLITIAGACILAHFLKLDVNSALLAGFLFLWILLFDLFTDVKQKNITWLMWWAIFLSVYMSALFFNFYIKKEIAGRSAFLAEAIKEKPENELRAMAMSSDITALDTLLSDLLSETTGIRLDKTDFIDYLSTQINVPIADLMIIDSTGAGIFMDNEDLNLPISLVAIDSAIAYDPIRHSAWFSRSLAQGYAYLIEVQDPLDSRSQEYPFNYYSEGKAIHTDLSIPNKTLAILKASDKTYLFKDSNVYVKWEHNGHLLVTRKSFDSIIKPIALFSLLFCMVIIFGLVISLINIWFDILPKEWPFVLQRADSLNSRIQISLILVILLSFVIIALITNSFLNNFLDNEKEKYFRDKIVSITNDIKYQTDIANSKNEMIAIAANFTDKISMIHDVDIKIVPLDSISTNENFFNYAYFRKNNEHNAYTEENKTNASSFIPLKFKGETVAYAALGHRKYKNNPVHVFDFLGSIFNVYVFLFLIASVLAIFLARSITRPLAMLNQKLGKLQLGKRNELISWDRDDEIGTLINNYNNMVHQLEESVQVLAKTERDSAWREMAKQVAHEIKNPLTPMKLSIQYLEKAIKQNPDNAKVISKKIANTLLEQIDNLAEIANAFGNFAELPQSSNVKIEINEVVELVHNLFRKREDMDITLSVPIDPIYVYGDKNQLIRILNNLVKNAVESVPTTRRGVINLELYTERDNAVIKVSDNGEGIPKDMRDKIFQPKFTTKDSGSGLGLAICANMIESMNGRLYFDSKEDVGTDFYIEMDIIRPSNYQEQDKRITLD